MKTTTENLNNQNSKVEVTSLESLTNVKAYFEMETLPVQEMSDLEQLQMQLNQLQSLHNRSRFMMKEISYLLKVD